MRMVDSQNQDNIDTPRVRKIVRDKSFINWRTMSSTDSSMISNGHTSDLDSSVDNNLNATEEITEKDTGIDLRHLMLTISVSLLAFPCTYILNNWFSRVVEHDRSLTMMLAGFTLLTAIVAVVVLLTKIHDWMFYGFTLFAFTAVIDTIITLEFFEIIQGYMTEYLGFGEPYLFSSWGSAITLFDGIGFYLMYLLLNFQLANRIPWRSTGIYWASGLLNSMIVFALGVFCGTESPTACTFLNIPYIIFPVMVLIRVFERTPREAWTKSVKSTILTKLYNSFCLVVLLIAMWFSFAKGLAALDCKGRIVLFTVMHEKALHNAEPGPFAGIQAIVFLLYLLPLQCLHLYYHFKTEKPQFLWDLTLIQAGAVLQGQFSYMLSSIDFHTPEEFRVFYKVKQFWFANLMILLAPHLLLLQLNRHHVKKLETLEVPAKKIN